MLKYIVSEYFRAYKWGNFKALWKKEDRAYVWFTIYWMISALSGGFLREDFTVKDCLMLLAVYLPMLCIGCSGIIHPVRLSKMMYLCPVSAEERKRYIYQSYYFRIGIHMCIAMIGTVLLTLFTYWDVISCLEILLCDLAVSLFIPSAKEVNEDMWKIEKGVGYKIVIMVIAVILNMVQLVIISDSEPHIAAKTIVFCVLLFIELPLSVKYYKKYVQNELRDAVYFEKYSAELR